MAGVVPADDAERRSTFEVLFRSHYRAVETYVMSRYSNLDHHTILSNTFEVAWRRLDAIPPGAQRGWLIGVARNCALNESRHGRRRQRRSDALSASLPRPDPHNSTTTIEVLDAIRAALAQLKPAERDVILLADWDGLTGADLGAALGVKANAATVRLHRARNRLRELLSEQGVTL
jgi:RNA polymerase sigma factor (sigma-70 family)